MDNESPQPTTASGRRRLAIGAGLGVTALLASILGVSAIAGAQDDPATAPVVESVIDEESDDHEAELRSDFDDNIDEDDIDPAWEPFDQCIETALAGEDLGTLFVGTLDNGGVGVAEFHEAESVVSPTLATDVDDLAAAIVAGEVVVE